MRLYRGLYVLSACVCSFGLFGVFFSCGSVTEWHHQWCIAALQNYFIDHMLIVISLEAEKCTIADMFRRFWFMYLLPRLYVTKTCTTKKVEYNTSSHISIYMMSFTLSTKEIIIREDIMTDQRCLSWYI